MCLHGVFEQTCCRGKYLSANFELADIVVGRNTYRRILAHAMSWRPDNNSNDVDIVIGVESYRTGRTCQMHSRTSSPPVIGASTDRRIRPTF